MSGRGLPPDRAPVRLLTILGDQPIGHDDQGRLVRPSMEFVQFLQRLISYIGQPVPANPAGVPISTVIGSLTVAAKSIRFGAAGDGALLAQVGALDAAIARLAALVPPQPELERGDAARAFRSWPVDVMYAGNGSRFLDGYGTPNGKIFGSVGDMFVQRDGTAAVAAWEKTSGAFTDHGWTAIGGELPNHQTVGSYTITAANWTELIAFDNATAVAVSLVQPGTASGVEASFYADIENINTGMVTLTPASSKIDGSTLAVTLSANQGLRIATNGTDYFTQRGMGGGGGGGIGTIVAGTGLTGGTITTSGTVALDSLGTGLTITSGTIWPHWQSGSVTALGTVASGITLGIASGTLTATGAGAQEWNAGTVTALGTVASGVTLAISSGTLGATLGVLTYANLPASVDIRTLLYPIIGLPLGSQKFSLTMTQAGTLLANGGTPEAYIPTNPTATEYLYINTIHSGTIITQGTITISVAGAVTWPTFSAVALAAGDTVQLLNQSGSDVTFADACFSMQFKVT